MQIEADLKKIITSLGSLPDPVHRPVLIVVSGLPGTGKTTVSRQLAQEISVAVIESDAIRKILFPEPNYTAEESAFVFSKIHQLIDLLLEQQIPVLLDATNLREANRQTLFSIAEKHQAYLVLINVVAPPEVVRERLIRRKVLGNTRSDASWETYIAMSATVDPIRKPHYVVDTSRDFQPVVKKIIEDIRNNIFM